MPVPPCGMRAILPGPGGPAFGLFLWLPLVVACAWPVAVLWERRVEGRHQREIAVLQRHRQETNLKLLVLQAQIEPHFLFNTLASLRALLREDATRAEANALGLLHDSRRPSSAHLSRSCCQV